MNSYRGNRSSGGQANSRWRKIGSGNSGGASPREVRVIVTALAERDEHLLLAQLARGPFAGFWLLPSATVEAGTLAETAAHMMLERTGHEVAEQRLVSVLEEPRHEVLAMRFVFATVLHGVSSGPVDAEFVQVRWFSRRAARGMLEERDAVPTLGVMSLIRSWADGVALRPHELLLEDAFCPCGSGFRYPGCCGWDRK